MAKTLKMELDLPSKVPETEYSKKFIQGMLDRMATSYWKYGAVAESAGNVDEIKSLLIRIGMYLGAERLRKLMADEDIFSSISKRGTKPGNTEWLMDVANFAMIEYMQPQIPKAHFKATDSAESPGLSWIENG